MTRPAQGSTLPSDRDRVPGLSGGFVEDGGDTWYRIDRSHLQAQVIVVHDDALAVIRPVNLWIDHQAGDVRSATPMDTPTDPVAPQRLLRRAIVE